MPLITVANPNQNSAQFNNLIPILKDPKLSITGLGYKYDYEIFPNPTSGIFTILSPQKANYRISFINGVILQTGSVAEGDNTVITSLSAGMYFVQIGNTVKKLIIF